MTDLSPHPKRPVRSFVRRTGRLTPGQQRALSELWPRYGIDDSSIPLDFEAVFGRAAPTVLEIGFGNGETFVQQATDAPDMNFIGIEVHEPGIGHCMLHADSAGLANLRIICHDAIEVLQDQVPDASLARINLYFPDPWPKKRHHKRRILQLDFLQLVATKLRANGKLHIATDWDNYAEHIDGLLHATEVFAIDERRVHDGDLALDRPKTKFEMRGLKQGHRITDWRLSKI